MKKINLRYLQHHLKEVMQLIEQGDSVMIAKRNKVIAKLTPAEEKEEKKPDWPDFVSRGKEIFGESKHQLSMSQQIIDSRKER